MKNSTFTDSAQHLLTATNARREKTNHRLAARQSGQALIVILAFSVILAAGLLSIHNTAKLTIAKRELVNAADATAYSGATMIAQGLNYTASTNRAILANNALIGQMTAIRSTLAMSEWYWKNTKHFWGAIRAMTQNIPYAGPIMAGIASSFEKFAEYWAKFGVHGARKLAEVLHYTSSAAISLTNGAIWSSQQLHLADSVIGFVPNMVTIAKDNAPLAKIDSALNDTLFGPAATAAYVAWNFKAKVRASKPTLNSTDGPKDEYLNYVTGTNRNVATPFFLGARTLLPNAIGLWLTAGCGKSDEYAAGGLLGPPAGLGKEMDAALKFLNTSTALIGGPALDNTLCMFARNGGSELVQLRDGKMAWVSIDAMTLTVPYVDEILRFFGITNISFSHRPMAGGAVMSFSEKNAYKDRTPRSVANFRDYISNDHPERQQKANPSKYMGHQVALPADCVEVVKPGLNPTMIAISTNGRTSGTCAVLATGVGDAGVGQGLWAHHLEETANRIIEAPVPDQTASERARAGITAALGNFVDGYEQSLNTTRPFTDTGVEIGSVSPPGVSGGVNTSTTTMPNSQAVTTTGNSLLKSVWANAGASYKNMRASLTTALVPSTFKVNVSQILTDALGDVLTESEDGDSIGVKARKFLRSLGLADVINMLQMEVSDGVEKPSGYKSNAIFNVLSDGLPPWFWDVRVTDKIQGATPGEEQDLVSTDEKPDNYNGRRYNLGPVVYLPLTQPLPGSSFVGAESSESTQNGGMAVLANFDDRKTPTLKALGKARIFFRQPSDQWMNRYKVVVNKSLLLPYWQVRNESLSYAEKWALFAIGGIADEATSGQQ